MQRKNASVLCLLTFLTLVAGNNVANATGVSLTPLVHGFDSPTDAGEVSTYIAGLNLQLTGDRQLVIVSGTHGICPTGAPDKSAGCRALQFVKEDYRNFHVNDAKYVQAVDFHSIKLWSDFMNKHSNDYIILAWCCSACWKGAPHYIQGCSR
jgi:hypothetical protein